MNEPWISKEDFDFYTKWRNKREQELEDWASMNGDDRIKQLRQLYNEIMEDDRECKSPAEVAKKIAIEFAKKLMETKITSLRGMNDEPEVRNSPDYALMKGELIINGDKLFDKFIEEYYE